MKAWVCRRFVQPLQMALEEVPMPQPGPGEVRVKVHAAGLAFGETLVLEGRYQKTPPLPYIPCSELSGTIDRCGAGVSGFSVGDRVISFSVSLGGGALAEYSVLPQEFVFPCPAALNFEDAAAFPMNYWTAFNALKRRGALCAGEVLVVHGASGGVGSAALDVGKALGAVTIATGSDDDRLRAVVADHVVNYRTTSLRERVLSLTQGNGADVYFDPVGGELFEQSMRAIAPGGRILVIGFTSGTPALARTNVMLVKMVSVIGVEGRLAIERRGREGWDDFRDMLARTDRGDFHPRAGRVYAFDEAKLGFEDILARRHLGKSVVRVAP